MGRIPDHKAHLLAYRRRYLGIDDDTIIPPPIPTRRWFSVSGIFCELQSQASGRERYMPQMDATGSVIRVVHILLRRDIGGFFFY